jgi:predicted AlkP superfamily pyrophosphatase or phosphodiesterase
MMGGSVGARLSMRRRLIAVAFLISGVLPHALARSQSSVSSRRMPDVLLITLDTARADRMGFLGSTRGLTPAFDALARTGVLFTRVYAQAPITTVSHATILTGTCPPLHGRFRGAAGCVRPVPAGPA